MVVFCIAAATTFWVLNALNKDNYSTIVDYPIQWEFNEKNFVAIEPLPQSIQIQISGNGWDLLRKYFNVGTNPYPILLTTPSEKDFVLTGDLKRGLGEFITPTLLENILGDTIPYKIDRIVTKTLIPVLDTTAYSLEKNSFIEGKVSFNPEKLEVTGPSSILDAFEGKFPVHLNAEKISENFSNQVPLSLEEKLASLVQLNTTEIQVSFSVLTYLEGNKRIKVTKRNFPSKVSLFNEDEIPVLNYLILASDLPKLQELEFEGILDYKNRNREDSTITLRVVPNPKFLKNVRITPTKLTLKYE